LEEISEAWKEHYSQTNKDDRNHSGMSHGYKEERILVGCEDVSCCALSLRFFFLIPSLTMPDLLVKKQQSSPRKRHSLPFSAVKRSNPLLF
jgi:hypothetical protein